MNSQGYLWSFSNVLLDSIIVLGHGWDCSSPWTLYLDSLSFDAIDQSGSGQNLMAGVIESMEKRRDSMEKGGLILHMLEVHLNIMGVSWLYSL
jgi:hypothetical protein